MLARRLAPTNRAHDVAERVLHADRLRPDGLKVLFGSSQAGKEVSDLAIHKVAAIEFGRDLNGQAHLRPGFLHLFALGYRADEITPKTDEGFHRSRQEALASFDRVHTLLARRLKAVLRRQFIQGNVFRFLGNSDGPLPLYIRVSSHGRDARSLAPDISMEQHQVDKQRDVFKAMHLLRQAHAVESRDAFGLDIDLRGAFDRCTGQARFLLDQAPVKGPHHGFECLEAARVLLDELDVEHALAIAFATSSAANTYLQRPRMAAMSPPAFT